ncbi:MAG: hypothetical protein ACD_2C00174G0003 [uncultured bacterium (gcode 4)]|uniref:Methyltransferase domain-containing protein n=1 Tax=uncultured bacterium (gcode 4) TaxID=1234023 RepID=K2FE61_9BACT|nr:MAG: hypothetical protein ACD_2C00174G0003 [uncultured bacterium (gcode 4)]
MPNIDIYTTTALAPSKEKNLAKRASYFENHYIPYLRDFWVFKQWNKCIELGCWQWHKLEKLIKAFPETEFCGLDNSSEMLGKAKSRLPGIELNIWNILNLNDISDSSADNVCLFQVLHHLDADQRKKAYGEILRILKPYWYIIVIDSFRPEDSKAKQLIWDSVNRFYAVLSQHSAESLSIRTKEAICSILMPSRYDPESYWYFSPTRKSVFWDGYPELELVALITPKVLSGTIKCISDMMIFQKK